MTLSHSYTYMYVCAIYIIYIHTSITNIFTRIFNEIRMTKYPVNK